MGYDLHITRTEEWSGSETNPISLEEWIAYVRSDPEMRLDLIDGYVEIPLPDGQTLRYKCKGRAEWKLPGRDGEKSSAWFSYFEGRIEAKNPCDEAIAKMCRIAKVLNARVQGDEGELYGEDSN